MNIAKSRDTFFVACVLILALIFSASLVAMDDEERKEIPAQGKPSSHFAMQQAMQERELMIQGRINLRLGNWPQKESMTMAN